MIKQIIDNGEYTVNSSVAKLKIKYHCLVLKGYEPNGTKIYKREEKSQVFYSNQYDELINRATNYLKGEQLVR